MELPHCEAPAPGDGGAEPGPALKLGEGVEPSHPLSEQDAALLQQAMADIDAGNLQQAATTLGALLERNPGNGSLVALNAGTSERIAQAHLGAALALTDVRAKAMPRPPFDYSLVRPVPGVSAGKAPRLKKLSERRNDVTDVTEWFTEHDLALPALEVPGPRRSGNLPAWVPLAYGPLVLTDAIVDGAHTLLCYGRDYGGGHVLAVVDGERTLVALLDFSAYVAPPTVKVGDGDYVAEVIRWAQLRDGILYVSHGHRTYAESSGGQNAYITAIELASRELLWRSAPLVANSVNFLIAGDHILTGYGFTAEPDYLFLLDRGTGKTVTQLKVRSGPDYLIEKGERVYVRTYDRDYVFELKP